MSTALASNGVIIIGALIYGGMLFAVIAWLRWRRRSRWPFPKEDKLLRGPGEELRRKLQNADEKLGIEMVAGFLLGVALFATALMAMGANPNISSGTKLGVACVAAIVVFAVSGWRIARLWQQRQNWYLGWFGERYVAEWLEPAKLQGWNIFHDVPFTRDGAAFNMDHIAVGPGGVFVFETKTRRKQSPRPGRRDHEVIFDGRELDWPWGRDSHGLEQAELNSQFLAQWIRAELGERVHVSPYLVLPGWLVSLAPAANPRMCRVANPKWLPAILSRERSNLSPKQVEQISLRLAAKCRDVED